MIGAYRHRVGVEVRISTPTATGRTETWTPVGEDWATVGVLSDRARMEFQQAGNPHAQAILSFRDDPRRHDARLTHGTIRFRWNGELLYPIGKIQSLDSLGRSYRATCESRED